jgi:hypothetical protein
MTTYYVSRSDGLDSNNGLSSGAPFRTIQKALAVTSVAGPHTVLVQYGDFNVNGTDNYLELKANQAGPTHAWEDITIQGCDASYNPVTDETLGPLFQPSAGSYCIYGNWAGNTTTPKTFRIKGMRVVSQASNACFHMTGNTVNGTTSVYSEDCAFTLPADKQLFNQSSAYNQSDPNRAVSFIDCAVDGTSATTAAYLFAPGTGTGGLTIQDCTFTNMGSRGFFAHQFVNEKDFGPLTVKNNTGTFGGPLMGQDFNSWTQAADPTTLSPMPTVDLSGNTLTGEGIGFRLRPPSATWSYAPHTFIADNDITVNYHAAAAPWTLNSGDAIVVGYGNATSAAGLGPVHVLRNNVTVNFPVNPGSTACHGIALLGGCAEGSDVAFNKVHMPPGSYAPESYGITIKDSNVTARYNQVVAKNCLCVFNGTSNTVEHNSCYSNGSGGSAFTYGDDVDLTFPEFPRITSNIFHAGVGTRAFLMETGAGYTDGFLLPIVNSNLYYKNGAGAFSLLGTVADTLAAAQAAWATISCSNPAYGLSKNDEGSEFGDPLFIDPANCDLRLHRSSPAIPAITDTSSFYNIPGACNVNPLATYFTFLNEPAGSLLAT